MVSDFFEFLKFACAVWYLGYAIINTHGAFGMFNTLRRLPHGGLLDCIICIMPWLAFAALLAYPVHPITVFIVDGLAVAGFALILHGFTGWRIPVNGR